MFLQMEQLPGVDNPRHYRPEITEGLEELLRSGVSALPDSKREGFYDIENHGRIFFIHISPTNGRVALLATWLRAGGTVEHVGCARADLQSTPGQINS
jgi:hypothetical protein